MTIHRSTIKMLRRGESFVSLMKDNPDKTVLELCRELGISRAMFYKVVSNYHKKKHLLGTTELDTIKPEVPNIRGFDWSMIV